MQSSPHLFQVQLIILICLTILVSAIFLLFPQYDIQLSGYFADGKDGFPLRHNVVLEQLRWLYMVEVTILCVVPTFMVFYARKNADQMRTPAQFWDLYIGSFFLGPFVLVNLIFKSNWGRPRPAQIEEFGGPWQFTPPYYISDQCQLNCSFVSGEGSAIATSGILLGLTAWITFPKKRLPIISIITAVSIIGISLRVIKGRHFTSDSLLAALFCALIIVLFYRFLKLHKSSDRITISNIIHDLKHTLNALKPKSKV